MQHAITNTLGKIWEFIDLIVNMNVMRDDYKQLTLKLETQKQGKQLLLVWYMPNALVQKEWNYGNIQKRQQFKFKAYGLFGGDFNVITHEKEKHGGLPVTVTETKDFKHYISMCNLEDTGFKGSKFT